MDINGKVIAGLHQYLFESTLESMSQIKLYAIVMLVNFPLFYAIWLISAPGSIEHAGLRVIIVCLCAALLTFDYLPVRGRTFFPYYWYLTLCISLPYFFSYMTLINHASTLWLMNTVSALFFVLLLLDVFISLLVIVFGVGLAFLHFFILSGNDFQYEPGLVSFASLSATYGAAIVIGGLFSRSRFIREKLKSTRMVGESIAHELRTPLSSIQINAETMAGFFSDIKPPIDKENLQKQQVVVDIEELDEIVRIPQSIQSEVRSAMLFIDMLLMSSNNLTADIHRSHFSAKSCIDKALSRYPFREGQYECIQLALENDFLIDGNDVLLQHVFFNLIKNALYFINAAGKGRIFIKIESSDTCHRIIFKDTGLGISEKRLPFIFNRFYSSNVAYGTGIGLHFCKQVVEMFGGRIRCRSKEGEYTEFTLEFKE